MIASNGHLAVNSATLANDPEVPTKKRRKNGDREAETLRAAQESTHRLLEEIQVPFDASLVRWRALQTQRISGRIRGFILPYADPRAYADRLNELVSPTGWTNTYQLSPTPRKVMVTCVLTIQGLGTHSSTGEEWINCDCAATAAEAQAFKRACACFGLGRYFYDFEGVWTDLDEDRRPRDVPPIPEWATPAGWRSGLRPPVVASTFREGLNGQSSKEINTSSPSSAPAGTGKNVIREILAMEEELGKPLYRGILTRVAKVWIPERIRVIAVQREVLDQMQAAQSGIQRAAAAQEKLGRPAVIEILKSLAIESLEQINDLKVLQEVVSAFESAAERDESQPAHDRGAEAPEQ